MCCWDTFRGSSDGEMDGWADCLAARLLRESEPWEEEPEEKKEIDERINGIPVPGNTEERGMDG